ncbi:cathepsin O-like [Plodia interpunctella]|uniref:cathepsin O-like n=1 Tax=Plodia interpunctella TaxID=58824 RepID=UPI002368CD23|nr:cathepsin O-like [Plodia interpunctella]
MKKWWNWVLAIALISLLFLAIPLSYSNKKQAALQLMFDEYVEKFNKSYKNNPNEYQTRFQHFVASVGEIERLNSESRGPEQYRARYGLTHLSDMSQAEYKELHLSDERLEKAPRLYGKSWSKTDVRDLYKTDDDNGDHQRNRSCGESHDNIYIIIRKRRVALPLQVDWRAKGVIGPVRDQGMCGACWAFSTVGAMEAMAAINTGKLATLSVQQMIDCAGLGNSGCAGGDICLLLDWLLLSGAALQVDAEYPLRLTDGACRAKRNATGVRVASFTCDDMVESEDKILEALATHGPVSVAVNALTWQNYLGGVIQYHCSGSALDLNHAVELVGYDLTGDVPYYIAKNSWGSEFGLEGYLHIAVGNNVCGLANEVASVDVK